MKKNKNIYFYIVAIGFIIFVVSCAPSRNTGVPDKVEVSDTLFHTTDSTSIATIKWKDFFKDQYLQRIIDSTLRNNQDILIAAQRVEVARANLMMAKAAFQPTVNGVVSAAADRYGDYTMNGVGNFDTNLSPNISNDQKIPTPVTPDYFIGFRSTWEIDLWGKLKNKKKAALARFAASEKGRQMLSTFLVAEISSLYYQLLALDNELKIIERNTKLQESALDVVRIQKEGGRATELAVKQFQAQVYNTKSYEYAIKQEIGVVENQISFLMGGYPKHIERDTAITGQEFPVQLLTGVPSSMLLRRPDIREAELQLIAAKADVDAARAAFLPSLTINPYLGLNSFGAGLLFNGGSFVYGILGGLTTPVFNQRQLKANHIISVAANKEVYYSYHKTVTNATREVLTTLNNIDNGKKMLSLKQQEAQELTDAVSSAQDLYVAGYATYLEIITAQKSVLEAELQKNEIRKNLYISSIGLYRMLGGGWE